MDWARAKTILIIFLFAINIFLFGTYMNKENQDREEKLSLRREVSAALSSQQIFVLEDKIPDDSLKIRHATVKVREDKKAVAESIFGEVTETVGQDNVVYSSEKGNMMFFNESFSLVYESGSEIRSEEEAKRLAEWIADKAGFSFRKDFVSCIPEKSAYKISLPQSFGGISVFGADIELKISSSGSVLGNGSFIGKNRIMHAEGKSMKVSALLFEFADKVKELGKEKIVISEIKYGYIPKHPAGGAVYLVPALELLTEDSVFHINMADGSLVEI